MDVHRIVSELDIEIARLQHIRAALLGGDSSTSTSAPTKGRRGRPKGSKNVVTASNAPSSAAKNSTAKKSKRVLSPEGRKRIADAMKRRWAERRKQAAK